MTLTDKQYRAFWSKVRVNPSTGCWEWQGTVGNHGYGVFVHRPRKTLAHRLSWTLCRGPIPRGEGYHGTCVCHTCDNTRCVRPDHLFLGSQRDNLADMEIKGRDRHKTTLGAEQVARVFELRATGISQRLIGDITGMSQSHVCNILNGKRRAP